MFGLKNFPLSWRRIFARLFLLFFFVSSNIYIIAVEQTVNNQSTKSTVIAGVDPIPLNGRLSFRAFTDREGLPQNAIQAMAFDRKGYLWVGTQDGAAYYNGRSWTVVNMPQRTVSNFVRSIIAASDGSIWFGRTAGGASRLEDGAWTSFDEKSGLGSARVNTILETRAADGSSILWFGTEKGVARLQGEEWTRFDDTNSVLPKGELNALAETIEADGSSVIWAGTEKGLARFAKNEWRLIKTKDGLVNDFVNAIFPTKETNGQTVLWIGTSAGISRYEFTENRWTNYSEQNGLPLSGVRAVSETFTPDGERTIWAGMDGGGLARLVGGRWTVLKSKDGLPSNSVFSLMAMPGANGTKTLWVGTDTGGLGRLSLGGWQSFSEANGLPANPVFSVYETKEAEGRAYWFGTYGGGLARLLNGNWTVFDKSSGLPDNTVFEMLETTLDGGERVLWAGTKGGGLSRFANGRWIKTELENQFGTATMRTMYPTTDENGERVIWFATGNRGLGKLHKGKLTFFDSTNSGIPHSNLFDVVESVDQTDGSKVLWVATGGGGVARFDRNEWTVYNTNNGLHADFILSLHLNKTADGKQYLWAGTEGGGAARLNINDPTAKWQIFDDSTTPAVANNTVYQIREDKNGKLYFIHNKGVTRFTPRIATADNPTEYEIRNFTTEDGLPSNEGNGGASFVDSDGRIWAGLVGGAAVYDPALETALNTVPAIHIERTVIGDKAATLIDKQSLSHSENHLTFEFALLSYKHEEATQYRTQLVGLEKEPSAWSRDFKKEFTALPPGDYTFKVWGRDSLGNISAPASISFSVKPAWWQTWWAYALFALAFVGLVFAAVRLRTKTLVKRNAALQKKVDERTSELGEKVEQLKESEQRAYAYAQVKSQFLANMSHEIRTPLNGVIGMTTLLLDTQLDKEQRERAELVKRSGDLLLTVINDILDFSKIEAGKMTLETIDFDLTTAVEDVLELAARKAQGKGIELVGFIEPNVPTSLLGDPVRLRQILINLVDNAIKFTERGEVSLRVKMVQNTPQTITLRYEVKDSGIGISQQNINKLFQPFTQADNSTTRLYGGTGLGLTISKQLVELMNGEINAESVEGEGSTFWFTARFVKSAKPEMVESVYFRGQKLLYIGDKGILQESVCAQLTAFGINVTAATDGETAKKHLASAVEFDAIIINSRFGAENTAEFAAKIRAEKKFADVPIILLASLLENREARKLLYLLKKPIRQAHLAAALRSALLLKEEAKDEVVEEPVVQTNGHTVVEKPVVAEKKETNGNGARKQSTEPRILLVEDDFINQQVALMTMTQMGYKIQIVNNGREAVKTLQKSDYDLVLMDCHMPQMDGFEATAEIRRNEIATRRTPIIALTASVLPEERARCLAVGMDDYLTKPLRRQELKAILERWLPVTGRRDMNSEEAVMEKLFDAFDKDANPVEPQALENLRNLAGGKQEFLDEIINAFLNESTSRFELMREAAKNHDALTLRRIAHTQKGASLNFGAKRLAHLCEELERFNNADSEKFTIPVIAEIEQEFNHVSRILELELNGKTGQVEKV